MSQHKALWDQHGFYESGLEVSQVKIGRIRFSHHVDVIFSNSN